MCIDKQAVPFPQPPRLPPASLPGNSSQALGIQQLGWGSAGVAWTLRGNVTPSLDRNEDRGLQGSRTHDGSEWLYSILPSHPLHKVKGSSRAGPGCHTLTFFTTWPSTPHEGPASRPRWWRRDRPLACLGPVTEFSGSWFLNCKEGPEQPATIWAPTMPHLREVTKPVTRHSKKNVCYHQRLEGAGVNKAPQVSHGGTFQSPYNCGRGRERHKAVLNSFPRSI